jgi:putative ABC transport system permease protein
VTLAPALDDSALIGFDAAARYLGAERDASTVYVRAAPDAIAGARELLGASANPERPHEVEVSRPSDALEARAAAKTAFTSLFLGLGAVALLVGGVGIANVMVISVLERRSEIGLRRALGATRRHVGAQFACESLLLATAGGAAGVALGALVTAIYARSQDWSTVVPRRRSRAGSERHWRSGPWPAFTRRCERRGWLPPRRCAVRSATQRWRSARRARGRREGPSRAARARPT